MSARRLLREAFRFALVGGSNTVVTFVLLAVLAQFMSHALAYSIVFLVGVSYTAAMTGRFVFSAEHTRGRTVALIAWYIVVYLIGLATVHFVDPHGRRSGVIIALTAVVVTAPLSFLGGRFIYGRHTHSPEVAKTGGL